MSFNEFWHSLTTSAKTVVALISLISGISGALVAMGMTYQLPSERFALLHEQMTIGDSLAMKKIDSVSDTLRAEIKANRTATLTGQEDLQSGLIVKLNSLELHLAAMQRQFNSFSTRIDAVTLWRCVDGSLDNVDVNSRVGIQARNLMLQTCTVMGAR